MMEQAGKGNVALLCMNVQKERTFLLFYNFLFLACYKIAGIHFQADKDTGPLKPVVEDLKNFIENDPDAYMFFNLMFEQVPGDKSKSPTGLPQVRDYQHMLRMFNVILTHAPSFDESGLVGFPFNAILDWSMATVGGWAAFVEDKVNVHIKALLDEWGTFLRSPNSAYVLNDDPKNGWFGADAHKAMPTFVEDFVCDPKLPHYGFKSWDDFFIRQFREGVRPVAEPCGCKCM